MEVNNKKTLEDCSSLELLKEIEKRMRVDKVGVSASINVDDGEALVCVRGKGDEDALFLLLYLNKKEVLGSIGNFEVELDKFYNKGFENDSETKILSFWDSEKDKGSPKEKMKAVSRLLLSEQVRKNLLCFKNSDKISFRYYPEGELKGDNFFNSRDFDWEDVARCFTMMVRGDDRFPRMTVEVATKAVSDIVLQMEAEANSKK